MFIFSTNTIINSKDGFPGGFNNVGGHEGEGLRWYVDEASDSDNPILRVARDFRFAKGNVVAVYKREYQAPEFAKVVVDLDKITEAGIYRIAILVRLAMGSQNPLYANDFWAKGKPFFIEFQVKTGDLADKTKLAKKVVTIAKKYMNLVYESPLLTITANGTTVVISATDEYQRFHKVELQQAVDGFAPDCCNPLTDFEAIDALDPNSDVHDKIVFATDDNDHELRGNEGFGTYRQIMKDLRLPTAMNTRWDRPAADDMPVFGGKYNEYIVYYCVNRGIMGSDAVGDLVRSRTHHVFYVLNDECNSIIADWEAALAKVATKIETVNKDKDDEALEADYDFDAAVTALNNNVNAQ